MDIKQIITDYIMKSILTTHGDMVLRGASIPERLAAVAVGQVMKSGGVGAKPAWGVPSIGDMNMVSGNFTRNTSGDEVVSGFGFAPKLFLFFGRDSAASNNNHSVGIDNEAVKAHGRVDMNGTQSNGDTSYSIYIKRDATNYIIGDVSVLAADGFTSTFVLLNTCSVIVNWLAIGLPMRLVQVISDYIRRSILTMKGDMVMRGASQPERLAAGVLKTFLAGRGAGRGGRQKGASPGLHPGAGSQTR